MENLIFRTNYKNSLSENDLKGSISDFKAYSVGNPALSYFGTRGIVRGYKGSNSSYFRDHEYDLYEIGRIVDTEALVARAFTKKTTLVFKEGFVFESKSPESVAYIRKRLREIEYISDVSFRKLLKEMAMNMIMFHNFYLAKVRKKTASSGKVRKHRGGREIPPIAGYFNLAPETIQTKVDEAGDPIRYRQNLVSGTYREYPDYNIIHGFYNRRTGFTMGTPSLEPVKDDIMALRRIEESVETLIYKNIFPIIHVKIGTEKAPAKTLPNGTSEVSLATNMLKNIEDNGGVVTSERVDIESIGAESAALRVESYLTHFKKRVYAGLGMSPIDFGEGGETGRATGEVLSAAVIDSVTDYQRELEEIITTQIFDELLLETGKWEHPFEIPEEERVHLRFSVIDVDEKIKKEAHTINKVNSGLLTSEEARLEIGKDPLSDEDMNNLHSINIRKKENEAQLEYDKEINELDMKAAKAVAAAKPKPASGSSGGSVTKKATTKKSKAGNTKTKQTKSQGAANSAKNTAKPKNQNTDTLSSRLHSILDTKNNIDIRMFRAHRLCSEYVSLALTDGIVKDYTTNEIDLLISNMLADLNEFYESNQDNFATKRVFARKSVDKLKNYINNIREGI